MDKNKLLALIFDYDNRVMDREDFINEVVSLNPPHNYDTCIQDILLLDEADVVINKAGLLKEILSKHFPQ